MAKVKLKVGDKAPLFSLKSYNAGQIDLAKEIEKQKIVLIFSRYFGCPICQMEFDEILKNLESIEKKGAKLIYITQSSEEKATKIINEKSIKFPIIPSTKDELYAQYGLGLLPLSAMIAVMGKLRNSKKAGFAHGDYEGWENQSPGQFIIDQQGIIIHMKKGWLDLEALLGAL